MASEPSTLDDGLDRATHALEKGEDYKASKAETFLNAAGMRLDGQSYHYCTKF